MRMHRIFIAINLPEGVKKSLASRIERWKESVPARWMKKENLHIMVEFIGNCSDQEVLDVINITKDVARNHSEFFLKLSKIVYGPDKKIPPKMIWVVGDISKELGSLKNDLDEELGISESKGMVPHITLGRIKKWDWQRMDPEERPEIDEDLNLDFEVNSIEVMEDDAILESIPLS